MHSARSVASGSLVGAEPARLVHPVRVGLAPKSLGADSRREENLQKTIALCGAPNAASAQRGRWALGRTLVAASLGLFALLVAERALAYCRLTTDQPMAGQSCAQSGIPLAWHRQCISYSVKDPGPSLPALTQIRDTADVCFKTWTAVTCNGQTLGLKLAQTLELAALALDGGSRATHPRTPAFG